MWKEALEEHPRLGPGQAVIYTSSNNENEIALEMSKWLNDHPFILTPLDCKGLEFDDCIIAFDVERKAWNLKDCRVASLRLLRELYVAITRAKRRVVILTKMKDMKNFFLSLQGCNIEESAAKVALYEFDSETTRDEWLKRGMSLFEVRNCAFILL